VRGSTARLQMGFRACPTLAAWLRAAVDCADPVSLRQEVWGPASCDVTKWNTSGCEVTGAIFPDKAWHSQWSLVQSIAQHHQWRCPHSKCSVQMDFPRKTGGLTRYIIQHHIKVTARFHASLRGRGLPVAQCLDTGCHISAYAYRCARSGRKNRVVSRLGNSRFRL
jgi:hypothetical protein